MNKITGGIIIIIMRVLLFQIYGFYPDEENDYIDKGRVSLFPRNSFNGLEQRTNDFLTPLNSTHNTDFADRRPNDNFSKAGMLEKG